MRQRTRKFIGAAILTVFVPCYALAATSIAGMSLPGTTSLTQTIYYAVAGLLWVLPAGAVITWMQRPERQPEG